VHLVNIYNVDQTNLLFCLETTYTWAKKGSKSVPVPACQTSQHATVMLGLNATVTDKLPPFLVFKGSAKPTGRIFRELQRQEGYTEECHYACNEKAWFNEAIILQWIDTVWRPTLEAKNGQLTYLLLDECPVHMTEKVIRAFNALITELELIPGGYTAK
jgi:DDE superfamily endonuclease